MTGVELPNVLLEAAKTTFEIVEESHELDDDELWLPAKFAAEKLKGIEESYLAESCPVCKGKLKRKIEETGGGASPVLSTCVSCGRTFLPVKKWYVLSPDGKTAEEVLMTSPAPNQHRKIVGGEPHVVTGVEHFQTGEHSVSRTLSADAGKGNEVVSVIDHSSIIRLGLIHTQEGEKHAHWLGMEDTEGFLSIIQLLLALESKYGSVKNAFEALNSGAPLTARENELFDWLKKCPATDVNPLLNGGELTKSPCPNCGEFLNGTKKNILFSEEERTENYSSLGMEEEVAEKNHADLIKKYGDEHELIGYFCNNCHYCMYANIAQDGRVISKTEWAKLLPCPDEVSG